MARYLLLLVVVGFIPLLVYLLRPRPRARLVFRDGEVESFEGTLPRPVRSDLEEVARHARLSGTVSMFDPDRLVFSRSIDEPMRQRIRNVVASRQR